MNQDITFLIFEHHFILKPACRQAGFVLLTSYFLLHIRIYPQFVMSYWLIITVVAFPFLSVKKNGHYF